MRLRNEIDDLKRQIEEHSKKSLTEQYENSNHMSEIRNTYQKKVQELKNSYETKIRQMRKTHDRERMDIEKEHSRDIREQKLSI
eukprot:UN30798